MGEKQSLMEKIIGFINQTMARYLRKCGWVAFYLEPQSRVCKGVGTGHAVCWLHLYNQEMKDE